MGRIVISNQIESLAKIEKKNEMQGFVVNKQTKSGSLSIVSYHKRLRRIENAYVNGNDYCFSAGTLTYNKAVGAEALKGIFEAFDGDVDKLRKQILGNYCLCICKNGVISIFVDKYHVYKVFYQIVNGRITLSSDLIDVLLGISDFDESEYDLMLESFQCSPYGEDTFVRDVKKLLGRQIISIDTRKNNIEIRNIGYKREHKQHNDINAAAKFMASKIQEGYRQLTEGFGQDVGINMTGGLDSRVVLGGCLAVGIKPTLLHAQGNSPAVTGTEAGDLRCVESMSKKMGLSVLLMDWKCVYPDNFNLWDDLFAKYGFDYKFYGGNPNFFTSYESLGNSIPLILETGLFGECMRIREQYNERNNPFENIKAFLQEYQLSGTNSSYLVRDDFYSNSHNLFDYVKDKFSSDLRAFGFNPDGPLSMDQFEEVRYVHHRSTDAVLINFLNQLTGCISVLSTEQVCEYLYDSTREFRAYGTLQLKIIENLSQDLFNIPFFSHCRECIVNKSDYRLYRKVSFNERVGKFLRTLGLKDSSFYSLLRSLKYKFLKNDSGVQHNMVYSSELDRILPAVKQSIDADTDVIPKYINTDHIPSDDSLIHIIYYAMNIHGLKLIKQGIFK